MPKRPTLTPKEDLSNHVPTIVASVLFLVSVAAMPTAWYLYELCSQAFHWFFKWPYTFPKGLEQSMYICWAAQIPLFVAWKYRPAVWLLPLGLIAAAMAFPVIALLILPGGLPATVYLVSGHACELLGNTRAESLASRWPLILAALAGVVPWLLLVGFAILVDMH